MSKKISRWVDAIKTGRGLKFQAARSSMALASGTAFESVLQFVRLMILTRLLAPKEFGLVALVMVVVVIAESITDAGVRLSVIQHKDGSDYRYLNAAWWFQAVRGLGLFVIAGLAAPWVADFYSKPQLVSLLRVSFLSILLNGLVSPRVHLLEREFRFGKWTFLTQLSVVLGTAITLILAYYLRNVWALVIGMVSERFFRCVITFVLCPFRPTFPIERASLSEILKFAKGIIGLSAMNLISREADVMVLGKIITAASLGAYFLAVKLAEQPMNLFSKVISPVLLPAFSAKKDDAQTLQRALNTVNGGTTTLMLPLVTAVAAYSQALIGVVYGPEYLAGAVVLSILSFNILFRSHTVILAQIFFGCGLPHLHRRASMFRSIFIVILIYPAAKIYGIVGAATVISLSSVLLMCLQILSLKETIDIHLKTYFQKWILGLGLAMGIAIPAVILRVYPVESLLFQIGLCAASYLGALFAGLIILKKKSVWTLS